MATLLLQDVNEQTVIEYQKASELEQRQVRKVIEDILNLWSQRRADLTPEQTMWQEMADFIENHQTFALNWEQNKLSREEMNARAVS